MQTRLYQYLFRYFVQKWRASLDSKDLAAKQTKLTDHALLRYYERIENIDVETKRKELEAMVRPLSGEYGGNGKFTVDGILFTVVEGRIRSVAKPNPGQANISGLNKNSSIARRWSF